MDGITGGKLSDIKNAFFSKFNELKDAALTWGRDMIANLVSGITSKLKDVKDAANAIADRILNEGAQARDEYIDFLRSGSSDTPINLLKIAGVDMSTEGPVRRALDVFDSLVDRLDELTKGTPDA